MLTLLPPSETLVESQRLIATIEQLRDELPFAEDMLATHRSAHHELETSHINSEYAVESWRAALARRWECEIAGRRMYKIIVRQLAQHYGGGDAPVVQLLSRGGAEVNSSPSELLADLRRLQAALTVGTDTMAFAPARLAENEQICAALEEAITEVNRYETQRRVSVLDNRMAREAYRRARIETRRVLTEHYGECIHSKFAELLG